MAIVGIGCDLVKIHRIEKVCQRHFERFKSRILSLEEQAECEKALNPIVFLAKRFAAKEAIAKALGTGFRQGLAFNQLQIDHDLTGAPKICFLGQAHLLKIQKGVEKGHLSLSDEKDYAMAYVILEDGQ